MFYNQKLGLGRRRHNTLHGYSAISVWRPKQTGSGQAFKKPPREAHSSSLEGEDGAAIIIRTTRAEA
jgi:hypothetical protein